MVRGHVDAPSVPYLDDGFRSWCDAREPALHRLAVLLAADEALARDLLREVLPRVEASWSRIGSFAADAAARSALVDACANRQPRGARTPGPVVSRPVSAGDLGDMEAATWSLLTRLDAPTRWAVVLLRHEGLDDAETGRLLGVPPVTVRDADEQVVAAVAELTTEAQRRGGVRSVADPGGLVTSVLSERADGAPYVPVPREEVATAAARLRRRRARTVATAAAALLALGVGIAGVLGDEPVPGPDPTRPSAAMSAPNGPLGGFERRGPEPQVPYLVGNLLRQPDGSSLRLPIARPRRAVRLGDDLFVTEQLPEGDMLSRIGRSGRVSATWPTSGDPVVSAAGSTLAWVERRARDVVLHRGSERQRFHRSARLVGLAGDRLVVNAANRVWVTDLRSAPRRLTGLREATSVAANGLVAAVSDDDAVVVDVLDRLLWRSRSWQPGALSPDGRYVAVVGATRTRLINAVLDARTGALVREVNWGSPAPGVLEVRWETPQTLLLLVADQGETAFLRAEIADGQVTRATSPMPADVAGQSRYRFAGP